MAVARTRLFSSALGMCVTCDVILPQRRDNAPNRKLPVLWLLHGAYGNHFDWIRRTNIERYAAPYGLAVVMPSAYNSCYTDMAHGGKYFTYISQELPASLQKLFNLSDRREDNFIAGLSMGGAGSLIIGLAKPEQYAAIGCLSAGATASPKDSTGFLSPRRWEMTFGPGEIQPGSYLDALGNATRLAQSGNACPRVFHACGNDDPLLPSVLETRKVFEAFSGNPFDYQFVQAPGTHNWEFWDTQIKAFIQYLQLPVVKEQYI